MLLLLVIVQRAAFSTGCYQRAKIFTIDRGRPSFARGNYGEQIILSATHMFHGAGIFTNITGSLLGVNVGKYTRNIEHWGFSGSISPKR